MDTRRLRITGIVLSGIIVLLGLTLIALLHTFGQEGEKVLYNDGFYMFHGYSVSQNKPSDYWHGTILMRCWLLGFIFVIPGLSGIIASFVYRKFAIIVHFVIGVLMLFLGGTLYTAGVYLIARYQGMMSKALGIRYDSVPWECLPSSLQEGFDDASVVMVMTDERCRAGLRMSIYFVTALVVSIVAWLLLLSSLLYHAFTFSHVRKRVVKRVNGQTGPELASGSSTMQQVDPKAPSIATYTKPVDTSDETSVGASPPYDTIELDFQKEPSDSTQPQTGGHHDWQTFEEPKKDPNEKTTVHVEKSPEEKSGMTDDGPNTQDEKSMERVESVHKF